jgi:hypothetical protein
MRAQPCIRSPLAVLVFVLGGRSRAGPADDISNNLASDLGPLLALFGEEMTKQFLSESTYWVDYLIFALAPIGIITAIVSVIRVCGPTALRAFIGRATEGDGDVEAELCTSTGRDVCELFNSGGGITRVLGRPRILEIVHYELDKVEELASQTAPEATEKGKEKEKQEQKQQQKQKQTAPGVCRDAPSSPTSQDETHDLQSQQRQAADAALVDDDPASVVDGDVYGTGVFLLRHHLISDPCGSDWNPVGRYEAPKIWRDFVAKVHHVLAASSAWVRPHIALSTPARAFPDHQAPDLEVGNTEKGVPTEEKAESAAPTDTPRQGVKPSARDASMRDTANPNLSLNVGITKISKVWFYTVAVLGLVLQLGVMVMAGLLTWKFQYTQEGAPAELVNPSTAINENRWPVSFIIGTCLIIIGMFCCAAFIGEHTTETVYERSKVGKRSHIFWLQPGNQTIGDQTFYPFAYAEDTNKPVDPYMSSEKLPSPKRRPFVGLVVMVTLVGFISQFIGLRGMHASISIAQLGIMIIMSFLRGLLRAQRLSENDNKLAKIQDQVIGHELDWLAFDLWRKDLEASKARKSPAKGLPSGLLDKTGIPHDWSLVPCAGTVSMEAEWDFVTRTKSTTKEFQSLITKLLHYRARLAHLTGHSGVSGAQATQAQEWNEDQVAVRQKARQVATAVCSVAEGLIGKSTRFKNIDIVIEMELASSGGSDRGHVLLKLEPPRPSEGLGWNMDSSVIEAILGLWVWSFKKSQSVRPPGTHLEEDDGNTPTEALTRQIFSFPDDEGGYPVHDIQRWLANSSEIPISKMKVPENGTVSTKLLWERELSGSNTWVSRYDSHNTKKAIRQNAKTPIQVRQDDQTPTRFFGWSSAPREVKHHGFTINVQILPLKETSRTDVTLEQAAFELFAIILTHLNALVGVELGKMKLSEDIPAIHVVHEYVDMSNTPRDADLDKDAHWEFPILSDACSRFEDSGLGSWTEGMLIMVPALRLTAQPEVITQCIIDAVAQLKATNVEAAESWLHLACRNYILGRIEGKPDAKLLPYQKRLLVAFADFYRRVLVEVQAGQRRAPGNFYSLAYGVKVMSNLFWGGDKKPEGNGKDAELNQSKIGENVADDIRNVLLRYLWIEPPTDQFAQLGVNKEKKLQFRDQPPGFPEVLDQFQTEHDRRDRDDKHTKKADYERYSHLFFISNLLRGREDPRLDPHHALKKALKDSALEDWPEVTATLLEDIRFPPDEISAENIFPFIERGELFMVQKMVEYGVGVGRYSLPHAIRWKRLDIVKYLVRTGKCHPNQKYDSMFYEPEPRSPRYANHISPLITAITDGQLETAYFLLRDSRTNVQFTDSAERTALHFAAVSGSEIAVKLLIKNSAARFAADKNGMTALHMATFGGMTVLHMVKDEEHKLLLKAIYEDKITGDSMLTQLDLDTSTENSVGALRALLEYRGFQEDSAMQKELAEGLKAMDKKKRTALHYAAGWGFQGAVKDLVDLMDDEALHEQDQDMATALDVAVMRGRELAVELLLKTRRVRPESITKGLDAAECKGLSAVPIAVRQKIAKQLKDYVTSWRSN